VVVVVVVMVVVEPFRTCSRVLMSQEMEFGSLLYFLVGADQDLLGGELGIGTANAKHSRKQSSIIRTYTPPRPS
jgi:hypothetical protein